MMTETSLARKNKADSPKRPTRIQWAGYGLSAVITLGSLAFAIHKAAGVFQSPVNIGVDAHLTSSSPQDQLTRSELIESLRQKARRIDARLLYDRRERLERQSAALRQGAGEVYDRWQREVDSLREQLDGKKVLPGTFAWDVQLHLQELLDDAPLPPEQLEQSW